MSERRDTRQVDVSQVQRLARQSVRPEFELEESPSYRRNLATIEVVGKCTRAAEKLVREAGLEPRFVDVLPEKVEDENVVFLRAANGEVVEAKTA